MAAQKTNTEAPMVNDTELTVDNIFNKRSTFELAVRMADAFSKSTIVPRDYQGNPANCLIALEMATRIGTAPMMVMQNLYIVNGRPAWSSQFIIAMINNSRKYKTEIQYDIKGSGDSLECTAYAIDHKGNKVSGPKITMQMAKDEGWLGRSGSKWQTMPEVMIRYRAVSFFGRLNCPDLIMGIYSADEVIDLPENQYQFVDSTSSPQVGSSEYTPDVPIILEEPNQVTDNVPTDTPQTEAAADFEESINDTLPELKEESEALVCASCDESITKAVQTFSKKKHGRSLCLKCQKEATKV